MTIKTASKKTVKAPRKVVAEKMVKPASTGKRGRPKKVVAGNTKPLIYADNQTSFWVTNGQILNSLVALRDALEVMEKEVYHYHAGEAHNDFANWVAAVLCDADCAKDLEKAKTPTSAKTIVVKHLKTYSV